MLPETLCAACGAAGLVAFYELQDVPASAGLLFASREEALACPRGAIRLAFCRTCGFIQNVLYDPRLIDYSSTRTTRHDHAKRDEEREMAERLVRQWDLRGKDVLDIGCGDGEFIAALCRLGNNRGLGIDPTSIDRDEIERGGAVRFLRSEFSEHHVGLGFDFICCRHTLDRVPLASEFVSLVRRTVGERREPVVYFEVPDAARILSDLTLWDVRYDRVSYFSAGSLARLFRGSGFDIFELCVGKDDGSLRVEAVAANGGEGPFWEAEDDLAEIESLVATFRIESQPRLWEWGNTLLRLREHGGRAVLWGMNDKAAAYLSVLNIAEEVSCVIEPSADASLGYVAGTGHEVLPSSVLKAMRPPTVVVTDKAMLPEARRELVRAGLRSELITI